MYWKRMLSVADSEKLKELLKRAWTVCSSGALWGRGEAQRRSIGRGRERHTVETKTESSV